MPQAAVTIQHWPKVGSYLIENGKKVEKIVYKLELLRLLNIWLNQDKWKWPGLFNPFTKMAFRPLSFLFLFVINYLSAAGAAAASISTFVIVVTKSGFY